LRKCFLISIGQNNHLAIEKEIKDEKPCGQEIDVGDVSFGVGFGIDAVFTLTDTVWDLW
jgi:hypothetical protein